MPLCLLLWVVVTVAKQSSRGTKWNALRLRVLERDGHVCAYCGREANSADHIIPKDAGGKDELGNLVAACLSCNGRKSNKILIRMNYYNPGWLASL